MVETARPVDTLTAVQQKSVQARSKPAASPARISSSTRRNTSRSKSRSKSASIPTTSCATSSRLFCQVLGSGTPTATASSTRQLHFRPEVYLSPIYAAVRAVPGVERCHRHHLPDTGRQRHHAISPRAKSHSALFRLRVLKTTPASPITDSSLSSWRAENDHSHAIQQQRNPPMSTDGLHCSPTAPAAAALEPASRLRSPSPICPASPPSPIAPAPGPCSRSRCLRVSRAPTTPRSPSLKTRDNDDFTIAFLDATSVVLDILTFYQERLANESYLRTAAQLRISHRTRRLIGYQPAPGISASVYLAFTLKTTPGAPPDPSTPPITIPPGTQVQSIPAQGQTPQTFETSIAYSRQARLERPCPCLPALPWVPDSGDIGLYLAGTATQLNPGDLVLLVGDERATQSCQAGHWARPVPHHRQGRHRQQPHLDRMGRPRSPTADASRAVSKDLRLPPARGALRL